jgi:hypothetical protein
MDYKKCLQQKKEQITIKYTDTLTNANPNSSSEANNTLVFTPPDLDIDTNYFLGSNDDENNTTMTGRDPFSYLFDRDEGNTIDGDFLNYLTDDEDKMSNTTQGKVVEQGTVKRNRSPDTEDEVIRKKTRKENTSIARGNITFFGDINNSKPSDINDLFDLDEEDFTINNYFFKF